MAGSRSASSLALYESGSASSWPPLPAPAALGSRGVRSCHANGRTHGQSAGLAPPASRGQWWFAVTTGEGGARCPRVAPQLGLPARIFRRSLTGAPLNYRPRRGGPRASALCISLIGTFQNLRHLLTGASTGPSTCYFRFLLLEPSRKILPNEWLVPLGTAAVAMAARKPLLRYWLKLARLTRLRPRPP